MKQGMKVLLKTPPTCTITIVQNVIKTIGKQEEYHLFDRQGKDLGYHDRKMILLIP